MHALVSQSLPPGVELTPLKSPGGAGYRDHRRPCSAATAWWTRSRSTSWRLFGLGRSTSPSGTGSPTDVDRLDLLTGVMWRRRQHRLPGLHGVGSSSEQLAHGRPELIRGLAVGRR
jgi:hypothetical protein